MNTRYLEKIPADKRLHALIGAMFAFGMVVVVFIFSVSLLVSIGLMPTLLVIFAWDIEFWQKWTKSGQFDHWDAIAVVLGGLPVIVAYWFGSLV